MATAYCKEIIFFVNGRKIIERNLQPESTVLQYLRDQLGLTGTKRGCNEGGCGACTVMISKYDHQYEKIRHFPANSCLLPLCAVDGMAVTTVEGIGSIRTGLHPVQERIVKSHGSQCGFCTPGMVMSMYTLLRNNPEPTHQEMESAFEGNLCRCTGYRPIIEGFKTFTKGCCGNRENGCCKQNREGMGRHHTTERKDLLVGDKIFNSEEFTAYEPTQDVIFPPELMLPDAARAKRLYIKGDRITWIRPTALEELLELMLNYPQAKLVIGNTEIGIEMKFKNQTYPILVAATHIPELKAVEQTEKGIKFGASVTLSTLHDALKQATKTLPEFKTGWFSAILDILKWFACPQIRNVVSIAGNIMSANSTSDLNTVFMAARCKLLLACAGGKTREVSLDENFFTGNKATIVGQSEVLINILIPFTQEHEYVLALKQGRRRENDVAIVNAAMRVLLEKQTNSSSWHIRDCSFSFGGMAPTTVMALKTMRSLSGRIWNECVVQAACQLLGDDLPLAPGAPNGQVEYRRSLASSLFFKFFLKVSQQLSNEESAVGDLVPRSYQSGIKHLQRGTTHSTQTFQEVPDDQSSDDVVGRPIPHLAAAKQATGEAIYCDDIPKYAEELYLALVFSQRAHAKIVSVDASEALCLPGIKTYINANDVSGSNDIGYYQGDEELFATDEVTCVGHVIGAIAAETQAQAQRAAQMVKIRYEDLPRIITIEEAIEAESFFECKPLRIQKGDLETGFVESDHVLRGEMRLGGQEHFYLETQVTVAIPKGEDGEMELFVSTQNQLKTQELVAKALGVPLSRIVVRTKRVGGAFGGKESRSCFLSCVVAVAAAKTGKPVRCMLDRNEDMISTGKRHPFLAKYKLGFTSKGKIKALDIEFYSNAGNSLDVSWAVMEKALLHMANCYLVPNIRGVGFLCKTNIATNTAFRGFGAPQTLMFAESWISDMAITCGISQKEVRESNFLKEGDVTHFNRELTDCRIQRVWDELLEKCHFDKRRDELDTFNKENRWKKRGIALTPTMCSVGFTIKFKNQGAALVHVYTDGSVLVTHGGVEVGQGLHTKMAQVAARSFGIPMSKIHLTETSTNTVPNGTPTAASASTDLNGMAVKNACEEILERLKPYQEKNPEGEWEDWVHAAYFDRVNLSANGFYKYPGLNYDLQSNSGRAYPYFSFGAACSEVEVDCLTGDHQILRTDIVMDVGNSINPAIDIGQIEGAFLQGLGMFTLEELRFSRNGVPLTTGPRTYKIPGIADIPLEFNVHLLRNAPNEHAICCSKGVGEPPLILAASVFYAIKDAISNARLESGIEGIFRLDSPATSERIRMACVDQFVQQNKFSADLNVDDFNVYP